ncbi:hypothetical protein [Planomicrobium sp. CPCC 101079]|uniref:hypothetical protein n=1 Tax=Planomicrobium sp. CPCC 101079 TaxID=2599618 RepID=UPI0011B73FDF|nr:hypothetical protein [Planomicrobium sp. CPCC 101079]TWT09322.1 hypothetical protein FQV28_06725 [Planomicrobium sp. CPCC 101079]
MPGTTRENRTFFQWINFFIPYVYTLGIILIIGWMLAASVSIAIDNASNDPKALFLQTESAPSADTANETWLNLLIKPIVTSDFNQVIFRGLFLLLVWMLLFLVIPVAFKKLKRLKLFNMEFEVNDIEQAAIQTIEVSATKANYMLYLTSDAATDRTLEILDEIGLNYKDVLETYLTELQEWYKNAPLDTHFSFELFTTPYPSNLEGLVAASKESGSSVIQNTADPNNVMQKNYLVYAYSYREQEYITVISSYTQEFDTFDQSLFESMHNAVSKNIEHYEYLLALTSPAEPDA